MRLILLCLICLAGCGAPSGTDAFDRDRRSVSQQNPSVERASSTHGDYSGIDKGPLFSTFNFDDPKLPAPNKQMPGNQSTIIDLAPGENLDHSRSAGRLLGLILVELKDHPEFIAVRRMAQTHQWRPVARQKKSEYEPELYWAKVGGNSLIVQDQELIMDNQFVGVYVKREFARALFLDELGKFTGIKPWSSPPNEMVDYFLLETGKVRRILALNHGTVQRTMIAVVPPEDFDLHDLSLRRQIEKGGF